MTSQAAIKAPSNERLRRLSRSRLKRVGGKVPIYGALLLWTFVALFPIYWTLSTSFKFTQPDAGGTMRYPRASIAQSVPRAVVRS